MEKSNRIVDTREAMIIVLQKNLEIAKLTETKLKGFKLLSEIKMTERLLRTTGIGQTIQAMTVTEDEVGDAALDLLNKWRSMIAERYMRQQRLLDENKKEKIKLDENKKEKIKLDENKKEKIKIDENKKEKIKRKQELSSSHEERDAIQRKIMKCSVNYVGETPRKLFSENSDDSSNGPTKVILKNETPTKLKLIDGNKLSARQSLVLPNLDASPERSPLKHSKAAKPILKPRPESNSMMRCPTKAPLKPSSESNSMMRCPTKPRVVTSRPAVKKSIMPVPIKPQSTETKPMMKEVKMKTVPLMPVTPLPSNRQSTELKREIKMKTADTKSKEKTKPKKSAPIMAKLLRAFKDHR